MKHLKTVFNALRWGFLTFITGFSAPVAAQDDSTLLAMDSVEISLLTCQPHDEVYSLYGHTAIRYHDMHKKGGVDAAFNYGVFNFNAPHFVARFVFGLTDYELGAFPYHLFQSEYRHFGSMVTEQVLNLTAQEKWQLRQALSENLRPENRIYRYNYFYNNCTTKARDIIEQCINGKVEYAGHEDYTPTYRDMVHEMTQRNPWARWGNDMLLGIMSDQPTTLREQEFLPHNLLYDFDRAQIYANGNYRPLVKERRIAVPAGVQMHEPGFPLSPLQCFVALLAVGFVLFAVQWRLHRVFVLWEVLLMLAIGMIGIVLFLMLFSQHPATSTNLQLLLVNPVHLFFLPAVLRRRRTRYWTVLLVMLLLLLVGAFFQHFAVLTPFLALSLLIRYLIHLRSEK